MRFLKAFWYGTEGEDFVVIDGRRYYLPGYYLLVCGYHWILYFCLAAVLFNVTTVILLLRGRP